MPRYYCDYCDTYLTHDSPSVRKQHNAGYKHKANVRSYYQQYEAQLNQSLIDQKVKEHLGAYRPVGPPYNPLRPGLPVLPTPQMPMHMPMPMPMPMSLPLQGSAPFPANTPLMPGMRPPVLARPPGAPGFAMPQMVAPPTAPLPGQMNSLPRPLSAPPPPPPMVPGSAGAPPTSSSAPPMFTPVYQGNMAAPPPGGDESFDPNARATEANH